MNADPPITSSKPQWLLAAVWLVVAGCAACYAVRQTALEWTPSAERSHAGLGAIVAWALVLAIGLFGFFISRWELWWAKLPLLVLCLLGGYEFVDLLVRYAAYSK